MRSEIQNTGHTKPELKYPCLMKAKGEKSGHVVLFCDKNSGTVVHPGSTNQVSGTYSTAWFEATNSFHWELLPSSEGIILSND